MPLRFEPRANDRITLFALDFAFEAHRNAQPGIAYAAGGRKAVVYKLSDGARRLHALKVFKTKYRTDAIRASCERLRRFEQMPGLAAAQRRVVLPGSSEAQIYDALNFAVLMPWVAGKTWFDVLVSGPKNGAYLEPPKALRLARSFLGVVAGLEREGTAHTDVSPGNVVIDLKHASAQLLDLEDIFVPTGAKSDIKSYGTSGYSHAGAESVYCSEGDRYSSAVLAAEMLVMSNDEFARQAGDEGFFGGHCNARDAHARFENALPWLQTLAPNYAALFGQTWQSPSLASCPKIDELLQALPQPDSLPAHGTWRSKPGTRPGATTRGPDRTTSPIGTQSPPIGWEHWTAPSDSSSAGPAAQPPAAATEPKAGRVIGTVLFLAVVILIVWLITRNSGC